MIAFFLQAHLSYKALFNWQGPVMFAMNVLFRPLLYIAIFSFFGRFARGDDAAESFAVGMAMWSAVVVVGGGVLGGPVQERWMSTLSPMLSTAGSRVRMLLAWGVPYFPLGLLAAAVGLGASVALLGIDVSAVSWGAVILSIVLVSLSGMAFYLMFAPLAFTTGSFGIVAAFPTGVLITLTGVLIPLDALPDVWRIIGHGLPITSGLAALRGALDGESLSALRWELLSELGVVAAYLLIGYTLLRLTEVYGRRTGALEKSAV